MLRSILLASTILLAGCVRLGFSPEASSEAGPLGGPDNQVSLDGHLPGEERALSDASLDAAWVDGVVDGAADGPADLAPADSPKQTTVQLINTGADPLNTAASGTLTWSSCASSFTGEVVVKGLAASHVYQLKLDQDWSVDYQTGKTLGSLCRTWDETIWQLGDVSNLLPAPHTGAPPGDVQAANIGDYLSTAEQDALYAAGHELSGYFVFAFFAVSDASAALLTEDDTNPAKSVAAQSDGFHLPFFADFSWHTSASKQKGFVTFPAGQYSARFLITREGAWLDPLVVQGVTFKVGSCP